MMNFWTEKIGICIVSSTHVLDTYKSLQQWSTIFSATTRTNCRFIDTEKIHGNKSHQLTKYELRTSQHLPTTVSNVLAPPQQTEQSQITDCPTPPTESHSSSEKCLLLYTKQELRHLPPRNLLRFCFCVSRNTRGSRRWAEPKTTTSRTLLLQQSCCYFHSLGPRRCS